MITRENYGEEHIRQLQQKSRKDPQFIERALYALGLLEALKQTGMDFIFKGGSCLMILLPQVMRLSTDIDIIVSPGTDVRGFIERASALTQPDLKILAKMKKAQPLQYAYLVKADRLLGEYRTSI